MKTESVTQGKPERCRRETTDEPSAADAATTPALARIAGLQSAAQNIPEASGSPQPADSKSAPRVGASVPRLDSDPVSAFCFLLSDFCPSSAAYISITHWQELRQAALGKRRSE